MSNNESQPNSKKTDIDAANETNNTNASEQQEEIVDNATESEQQEPAASTPEEKAITGTATPQAAAPAPAAGFASSNQATAHAPAKKGGAGWIVLSAVLAIALIVVLIKPPFGGGSNEAVATVNGTKITKNQLYDKLASVNGEAAIDGMIIEELVRQQAEASNITITDQDITDEVDALKLNYESDETFEALLKQYGITMEELREDLQLNVMVRKVLESKTNVTDEDVQTFFDENKGQLGGVEEQVRASHILVESKDEAEEILASLKNGADFAETAREKSIDDYSAQSGGDLDFFTRGEMVEVFSNAAFALENDQISDIVQSQHGYHIIKRTDYKAAVEPSFDNKKSAIRTYLVGQEVNTLSSAWIEEIREKATITNTFEEEEEAAPSDEPAAQE